jgi:hypothetical protein
LKDDFGFDGISFDSGAKKENKKKGKKIKTSKFSSIGNSNDFGFGSGGLNLDFGFSSPSGKEPKITNTVNSRPKTNEFGMVSLGNMFGSPSGTKMKMPKAPKIPTKKISNSKRLEARLKDQAAQNRIKAKYGIKTPKGAAVEPQAPTLAERINDFKNKRQAESLRKKAGIPKDYEKNIAAEKRAAEIKARAVKDTMQYADANQEYEKKIVNGKTEWIPKQKLLESTKLEKLKAKIKKQKRIKYRFTITREGESSQLEENSLSDAQRVAGGYRSQGFSVSPISQVIF